VHDLSQERTAWPTRWLGLLLITAGVIIGGVTLTRALTSWWHTPWNHALPPQSLPALPMTRPLPPLSAQGVRPRTQAAWPALPISAARLPALRIRIPAIELDAPIVSVRPISTTDYSGTITWQWDTADYAVGHQNNSAHPGGGSNIVLTGHNNTKGEVFRDLVHLEPDDVVHLQTVAGVHSYRVRSITIVPYRRDPEAGEARLQEFMAPTAREQLTLISCYPYFSNADRIVIIADPLPRNTRKTSWQ
jgi:LPXTG-site transpeptidase (sortase) family protein